jgi:hypothetical protein
MFAENLKEVVVAKWRYYPGICLEGMRKSRRNLAG